HAHGRGHRRAGTRGDRHHGKRRRGRGRGTRGRRARRRALLAAALVGRLPRPDEVRHRRREELRRPGGGHDHGGVVPARVRGRLPVGPSRHRGHRVHGRRHAVPGEGPHRHRRAPVHGIRPQARRRLTLGGLLLLLAGAPLAGQQDTTRRPVAPAVQDTTRRDSTAKKDTTGRDTVAVLVPRFAAPIPAGPLPAGTRYTFTADSF